MRFIVLVVFCFILSQAAFAQFGVTPCISCRDRIFRTPEKPDYKKLKYIVKISKQIKNWEVNLREKLKEYYLGCDSSVEEKVQIATDKWISSCHSSLVMSPTNGMKLYELNLNEIAGLGCEEMVPNYKIYVICLLSKIDMEHKLNFHTSALFYVIPFGVFIPTKSIVDDLFNSENRRTANFDQSALSVNSRRHSFYYCSTGQNLLNPLNSLNDQLNRCLDISGHLEPVYYRTGLYNRGFGNEIYNCNFQLTFVNGLDPTYDPSMFPIQLTHVKKNGWPYSKSFTFSHKLCMLFDLEGKFVNSTLGPVISDSLRKEKDLAELFIGDTSTMVYRYTPQGESKPVSKKLDKRTYDLLEYLFESISIATAESAIKTNQGQKEPILFSPAWLKKYATPVDISNFAK